MQTLIALLRAVNVGGNGKLPMADLRLMAEDAGFLNVCTYIQSGNLIFSSSEKLSVVQQMLEKKLEDYAGKSVGIILRTASEMRQVIDDNPFKEAEPNKVGVLFLNEIPSPDIKETAKGQSDEQIKIGKREVFIYYPSGMGRSKLKFAAMKEGTIRNINTVTKLIKIVEDI